MNVAVIALDEQTDRYYLFKAHRAIMEKGCSDRITFCDFPACTLSHYALFPHFPQIEYINDICNAIGGGYTHKNSWGAVYTRNSFPGSPVLIGRKRLSDGGPIQGIVVNNKVVCKLSVFGFYLKRLCSRSFYTLVPFVNFGSM